jgi:hypothetical protein
MVGHPLFVVAAIGGLGGDETTGLVKSNGAVIGLEGPELEAVRRRFLGLVQ